MPRGLHYPWLQGWGSCDTARSAFDSQCTLTPQDTAGGKCLLGWKAYTTHVFSEGKTYHQKYWFLKVNNMLDLGTL